MPRNGTTGVYTRTDGTRTGTTVWTQAKNAGVKIVSTGHDTHDQDIATALNDCLTQDNKIKPTANFLPNADGTLDLGSSSVTWNNQYLKGNLHLIDGASDGARFYNAANYVELRAPATLAADRVFTLPNTLGSSGNFLQTDGTGVTSWVSNPGQIVIGYTKAASGTQYVTFANADLSTINGKKYEFVVNNCLAATGTPNFIFQYTTDNVNYNNFNIIAGEMKNGSSTITGFNNTTSVLNNSVTTTSDPGYFHAIIHPGNGSLIHGEFVLKYGNGTNPYIAASGTFHIAATAWTGFRFGVSSGNMSCDATVYKYTV